MDEICENCPEFMGRDKFCRTGLWIGIRDMRICADHPCYTGTEFGTRDTIDERRKMAIETHGEEYYAKEE